MGAVRFVMTAALIVVLSGAVWADYATAVLLDNPIAYWRLGEDDSTEPAKNQGSIGAAGDGVYTGGILLGHPSLLPNGEDQAAEFDGLDGEIRIPDHAEINTGGPYTARSVEVWFRADLIGSIPGVLWEEGGLTRGLSVYVKETFGVKSLHMMGWNRSEEIWEEVSVSVEISEGETYYAVMVFAASENEIFGDFDGRVTGYLNGEEFATRSGADQLYNHGDDGAIGGVWTNARFHNGFTLDDGGNLIGVIDEVALYSVPLDDPNGDNDRSDSRIPIHYAAAASNGGGGFKRGDANADGTMNIADAVCILGYLFGGAEGACLDAAAACRDAADSNDDGLVNVADAVYILQYIFLNAGPPPDPFETCGDDPTDDGLECVSHPPCAN